MACRLPFLTAAVALTAAIPCYSAAQAQSWEKLITPGLTYRMEIDLAIPRVIHAFRYTPGAFQVTARPELAGDTIYDDSPLRGRQTLIETIQSKNAIAGINADFFPWTGDPIGGMVRTGELISTPFHRRATFGWGPGYHYAGPMTFKGQARQGNITLDLAGVNQACKENQVVLTTPTALFALSDRTATTHLIVEVGTGLSPVKKITGRAVRFVRNQKEIKVEPGTIVLTATAAAAEKLSQFQDGAEMEISVESGPYDWSRTTHVVGGGPLLVKDGKVSLNVVAEGFANNFATGLHPRTAVGATAFGDIWTVVVDGRQAMSRGTGLDELARVMQRLGCVSAINLDGGGSSTLAVAGLVLNRPSEGSLRPIANSLLFFGEYQPNGLGNRFVIRGSPRIVHGQSSTYAVVSDSGDPVPNGNIVWSATGAAWIDQGGVLRTLRAGTARLTAWINGRTVSVDVTVEAKPQ